MSYTPDLIRLAQKTFHQRELASPKHSSTCISQICGSQTHIDIKVTNGIITDFAHETTGALYSLATCAIVNDHIVGTKYEEIKKLRQTIYSMLKHNGPAPKAKRWKDFALLKEAQAYPTRHASILLILDCVLKALENKEIS